MCTHGKQATQTHPHSAQDFLKPGSQGGGSKAELQGILDILGAERKRPACLDRPPITATATATATATTSGSKRSGKAGLAGSAARPTRAHAAAASAAQAQPTGASLFNIDADQLLNLIGLDEEASCPYHLVASAGSCSSSQG